MRRSNSTSREYSFSIFQHISFLLNSHFYLPLPFFFFKHPFFLHKLLKFLFICVKRMFNFLFDVWLFSCIFATLNPSFHLLQFQFIFLFNVIIIVCLWKIIFQPFQIFWIEFNSFQQLIEIIFTLIIKIKFSFVPLTNQVA